MSARTTRFSALAGCALLAATIATAAPAMAQPSSGADRGGHIADVVPATMLGQPLMAAFGNYVNGPTATGAQFCDPITNPEAAFAKTRYSWIYYNAEDDTSGMSSDVTISTWRNARVAFQDVVNDTGRCAMVEGHDRVDWPGVDQSTHALFRSDTSATAVIRDGRHIIAVDVYDWDGNLDEVRGATFEAIKLSRKL